MRRRRAITPDPCIPSGDNASPFDNAAGTKKPTHIIPPSATTPRITTSQAYMALPSNTTIRDRTHEFLAIVESARASSLKRPGSAGGTAANVGVPIGDAPHSAPRSDFTRLAANVGKDIQATSAKLAKLTKLAQRRSLFDDPTAEIQDLTLVIKQDIALLNGKLSDLQRLRDAARRTTNKQAGDHSENVVESLKGRLGSTAQGFQKVLKMRTDSLAAQQDRRSHFMSSQFASPAFDRPSDSVALDLGQGSLGASVQSNAARTDFAPGAQATTLVRRPGETTYQTARADAVRQVESTIVELGQIFNQLATMVSEQGELVQRIDANVEDTVINMEAGQNQLMIYYNSIAGNRSLILKVFAVLLAFLVLWTVIL